MKNRTNRIAVLIGAFLLTLSAVSLVFLLLPSNGETDYIADIYQNGELLTSIPLTEVQEIYTFTVTGDNGSQNRIEVRPGSIGIISADCPDKLCIHQGFVSDSKLPVTCLPNRLVIQLRPAENPAAADSTTVDIITY